MELRISDEEREAQSSQSGAGRVSPPIGSQAGEDPWDYDKFKDLEDPGAFYSIHKPIRIDVPPDHAYSIFPKISKIFMYLAVLLLIGVYVLMCAGRPVDILFRIQEYKMFLAIGNGILFLDAVIVNWLYERKFSLLILAWLFPFAYPLERNHHVDDRAGFGGIFSFVLIAAFLATGVNVYHTYVQYGEYCMEENETVRHSVADLMDQKAASGERQAAFFKRNYNIEQIQVNESGTVIQLEGYGQWYMSKMGFEPSAGFDIPTTLVYRRQPAGGYLVTDVVLSGSSLSEADRSIYEEKVK